MQVIINMFVPAEGARGSTKARLSAQCQRNRLPQFHTCIMHEASSVLNSFVIRRKSSLTLDLTSTKTHPTYASNVCQLALANCARSARHAVIYCQKQELLRPGRDALMCSLGPLFFFHKGALVSQRLGLSDQ